MFVLAVRRPLRALLLLAAAMSVLPVAAHAQGKLEARYVVSIAGIPIGKGTWAIDITDTRYTAAASGTTTGLIRVFTGGQGTSAAHGTLHAGAPINSTFASTVATGRKTDEVPSPSPTAWSRNRASIRRSRPSPSACRSPTSTARAFSIR